ncbi:hypothetical protein AN963_20860 [Brevibacillus choshinensis]|uniref:Uncharacterized protein n=1 Tax=Brevibacillus choshinensis TaxID=54911 RepID=A0ABR5N088_BRECH|nr:hypothetical protein AN963_20860 [Brevibacillus choshinensis]
MQKKIELETYLPDKMCHSPWNPRQRKSSRAPASFAGKKVIGIKRCCKQNGKYSLSGGAVPEEREIKQVYFRDYFGGFYKFLAPFEVFFVLSQTEQLFCFI